MAVTDQSITNLPIETIKEIAYCIAKARILLASSRPQVGEAQDFLDVAAGKIPDKLWPSGAELDIK